MNDRALPSSASSSIAFTIVSIVIACVLMTLGSVARAERIKDLANIQGVRPNQLLGYGLVVGLDGSGDQTTQTPFTVQSLTNMLSQLGVQLPPGTNLQLKNVAAVMVTAVLPAFSKPGQMLDITVSSLGNAKSLRGGTLLFTPLKGADGNIYAIGQGNLIVGGAGASQGKSSVTINHLSAGRIPNGATVERAVVSPFSEGDAITLEMQTTDFSTTSRVVDAINLSLGTGVAHAIDGRVIRVASPQIREDRVGFMARLENVDVERVLPASKVIINARTGSVVMNQMVMLERCAVAHGNLSITINSTPVISQPTPFSQGQTVVSEKADIQVKQDGGNLVMMEPGARLTDVIKALNALGATPGDLVSILQAMKSSGALRAELEVI